MSNTMGLPPRAWAAIEAVANRHAWAGVTPEIILGRARQHRYSHPRQEAYAEVYDLRKANGERAFSLPAVGRIFGGRDHTTILHGIRSLQVRLSKEQPNAA